MDKNNEEVFRRPTTLLQQTINDIMRNNPTKDMMMNLIELQLYKNAGKDEDKLVFVELYNLLGIDKFMEVMDILSGKTVKFPAKDDFKETVEIALSYYYRYYMHYSWDTIKEKLGDQDIPSVKYGIKVQQLERFMEYIGDKVRVRIDRLMELESSLPQETKENE
jgi:hypothetical protein